MNTITIPKQLTKNDDLVVMPRREYEALLEFKKAKEFKLSATHKKALFIVSIVPFCKPNKILIGVNPDINSISYFTEVSQSAPHI